MVIIRFMPAYSSVLTEQIIWLPRKHFKMFTKYFMQGSAVLLIYTDLMFLLYGRDHTQAIKSIAQHTCFIDNQTLTLNHMMCAAISRQACAFFPLRSLEIRNY